MPMNIADLEDAEMRARERFGEFQREVETRWYAPLRNTMIGAMWRGMDPGTRQQLRTMRPASAQVMDQRYGGGNGSKL